ncbi:hypothetical protein Bhyg_08367, partial [Pseudolycoriella hygida]
MKTTLIEIMPNVKRCKNDAEESKNFKTDISRYHQSHDSIQPAASNSFLLISKMCSKVQLVWIFALFFFHGRNCLSTNVELDTSINNTLLAHLREQIELSKLRNDDMDNDDMDNDDNLDDKLSDKLESMLRSIDPNSYEGKLEPVVRPIDSISYEHEYGDHYFDRKLTDIDQICFEKYDPPESKPDHVWNLEDKIDVEKYNCALFCVYAEAHKVQKGELYNQTDSTCLYYDSGREIQGYTPYSTRKFNYRWKLVTTSFFFVAAFIVLTTRCYYLANSIRKSCNKEEDEVTIVGLEDAFRRKNMLFLLFGRIYGRNSLSTNVERVTFTENTQQTPGIGSETYDLPDFDLDKFVESFRESYEHQKQQSLQQLSDYVDEHESSAEFTDHYFDRKLTYIDQICFERYDPPKGKPDLILTFDDKIDFNKYVCALYCVYVETYLNVQEKELYDETDLSCYRYKADRKIPEYTPRTSRKFNHKIKIVGIVIALFFALCIFIMRVFCITFWIRNSCCKKEDQVMIIIVWVFLLSYIHERNSLPTNVEGVTFTDNTHQLADFDVDKFVDTSEESHEYRKETSMEQLYENDNEYKSSPESTFHYDDLNLTELKKSLNKQGVLLQCVLLLDNSFLKYGEESVA